MTDIELLNQINKAAYEVRLTLAPGYLEKVYKNALMLELQARGLKVYKEYPIKVYYKGVIIGEFSADFLVEDRIILEIKAVSELNPVHERQLVNYLTSTGLDTGVLINYGGEKYSYRVKDRIYKPAHAPKT